VVAVRVVHLQNGADPYKVSEFIQRVWFLANCTHSSIVQFYGAVHAEATTVWVVMEYLHAKSVRELIRMQKQFNERQVATICAYSLLGMAYLHSNNVVLKSIKSSNILITETGDIKLADYGLNPWMNEVAMKTAPFDEVLEAAYNAPELNMNAVTSKVCFP
jgi:serine/threonine protein kinase